MSDTVDVETALDKFEAALQQLETAMVKMHEHAARVQAATSDADSLRQSQAKLSRELDEVRARSKILADQNRLAAKRIDQAMARIKRVLGE